MINFDLSFNDYLKLLYSETTMIELITYYFIVYILTKLIQKILNYKIENKLHITNYNIMFIFSLIIVFELISQKVNLFYVSENLLNNLVIVGSLLILLILIVKTIIYQLFLNIYSFIVTFKTMSKVKDFEIKNIIPKNSKFDFKKVKKFSEKRFDIHKHNFIELFVDIFILIYLFNFFYFLEEYLVSVLILFSCLFNIYFSFNENFINVLKISNSNFSDSFKSYITQSKPLKKQNK